MKPVTEAGAYATWISPPKVGIDNKPGDFEYVKIETPPGEHFRPSAWALPRASRGRPGQISARRGRNLG